MDVVWEGGGYPTHMHMYTDACAHMYKHDNFHCKWLAHWGIPGEHL